MKHQCLSMEPLQQQKAVQMLKGNSTAFTHQNLFYRFSVDS